MYDIEHEMATQSELDGPVVEPTESAVRLEGLRVGFVGKLGGVTKREAQQLIREHGGTPVDPSREEADWIVIGADELPLADPETLLTADMREAAATGSLEIISETQLWQRLGEMDGDSPAKRLYTPAMLADLLQVPLATVRQWCRRKLIVPTKTVHRLPYFDFQEVATARQLAAMLAAGASAAMIERRLAELSRYLPEVERPLAQLPIIVEGQRWLLREGELLVEPSGQRRIDFDAIEKGNAAELAEDEAVGETLKFEQLPPPHELDPLEMLDFATSLEELGRMEEAADWYRAAMAAGGPQPEVCFQLAELLYRLGDASGARERYYMAIEMDEDFVEARANLGCVLAETGQLELAVAAFEGALTFHPDYPDVHYHMARALDDLERLEEAERHWREFLELAPESPWADEARDRLGIIET